MKEKLFYKGIYGTDTIAFVRDTIHIVPMEKHFLENKGDIKPHAHNSIFQIFLIQEGSVTFLYNDREEVINSVSFITVPKNVLHGFKQTDHELKGWIITLSDIAIERMLTLDAYFFSEIDKVTIAQFDFSNILFTNLYSTLHKCINEYNGSLPAREFALEYLTGMALIRLYRIPQDARQTSTSQNNTAKIYYRRFAQLLKENTSLKFGVDDYARLLSISSGHLNRICRQVAGKPPKEIILEHLIAEAKSQLENFELAIAQIAFNLGFDDPAYFTRLFHEKTGITPTRFRKGIGIS